MKFRFLQFSLIMYTACVGVSQAEVPEPIASTPLSEYTQIAPPGFVRVESGIFQMDSIESFFTEMPAHMETVKGFYMGKYLITQKEWIAVMGDNPSFLTGDNLPVERISWGDAIEYCNRLSEKEGLTPAYSVKRRDIIWNPDADGYRLPTETEWEYAAKGGNGSVGNYYSESDNFDDIAWHKENSGGKTHEVGTKIPNGLGLYDMIGNVWEWCWDLEGEINSQPYRVVRGGYSLNSTESVRSVGRSSFVSYYRYSNISFRLVLPFREEKSE